MPRREREPSDPASVHGLLDDVDEAGPRKRRRARRENDEDLDLDKIW